MREPFIPHFMTNSDPLVELLHSGEEPDTKDIIPTAAAALVAMGVRGYGSVDDVLSSEEFALPGQRHQPIRDTVTAHLANSEATSHVALALSEARDAAAYPLEEYLRYAGALHCAHAEIVAGMNEPSRLGHRTFLLWGAHAGWALTRSCYRRLYTAGPEHDLVSRFIADSQRAIMAYDAMTAAALALLLVATDAEVRTMAQHAIGMAYRQVIDQHQGIDRLATLRLHAIALAGSRESSGSIDGVIDAVAELPGFDPNAPAPLVLTDPGLDTRGIDTPLRTHIVALSGHDEPPAVPVEPARDAVQLASDYSTRRDH